MKKRKGLIVVAVMAAVSAIGLLSWKDSLSTIINKPGDQPESAELVFRPVPTVMVAKAETEIIRTFPGSVRADNRVELSFSVDGLIEELDIREGQRVSKGEVLARLDARDFNHALDASTAQFGDAKRAFERAEDLYGRKVISKAKYDAARTVYEVATADLRIKKKALEDTVVYAPFDGIVSKRYAEKQEHVKARTPILGFKDISMIEVVIRVPEKFMANGGTKRFAGINVRFDADENRWFEADVKEFSVQSDPVSRTYDVVVVLSRPDSLEIFPGMTASVKITSPRIDGRKAPVLLAPVEAVVGGADGKSYVWVIPEKGGNPVKTEIVPGAICDQGVEVVQGLLGSERIAVAGVHTLLEDMLVRPARKGREGLDV